MRRVHTSYDVRAGPLFLVFTGFSEKVAQFFARLETDRVSGRDLHFDPGLRIAADSFFALLDLKYAEAAQLDALPARDRVAQPLDHRVDGLGGLDPRDLGRLRVLVYDVRLDHVSSAKALIIRYL